MTARNLIRPAAENRRSNLPAEHRNCMRVRMILAFDVGNTNIKIALAESESLRILQQWRIDTNARLADNEYISLLEPLFKETGIDFRTIEHAVISSVVPQLTKTIILVSRHFTGRQPVVIAPKIYGRLPVKIPESAVYEIGTDLLCDAVEAWCRYKQAAIAVNFGTALSFTAIDAHGTIAGIAIAPGIRTALKSLFTDTAQIPYVPLEAPPSSLGKNTARAVQSGIVLGCKGLVESLIDRMKNDLHAETGAEIETIPVIATGGLSGIIEPVTDVFTHIDKNFTMLGIIRAGLYAAHEI